MKRRRGITARLRARKARKDAVIAALVRDEVRERDGYCRYAKDTRHERSIDCAGPPQWAHFGEFKRFKTRGMAPEIRHQVAQSLYLCEKHHTAYDNGTLDIIAATDCNGMLTYRGPGDPGRQEAE